MSVFAELLERPATIAAKESTDGAVGAQLRTITQKTANSVDNAGLLAGQMGLDIVGIFDRTGVADLASAGVSFWRGDFVGGTLSVLSAIPVAEFIATPLKAARNIKQVEQIIQLLMAAKAALAALPTEMMLRGLQAVEAMAGLRALRQALGSLEAKLMMIGDFDIVNQLREVSNKLFRQVLEMEIEVAKKAMETLAKMKSRIGEISKVVSEGSVKLMNEVIPRKVTKGSELDAIEGRITKVFAKMMTDMDEYRRYYAKIDELTKKFDLETLQRSTDPEQLKALARNTDLSQRLKATNAEEIVEQLIQSRKEFRSAEQNFALAAKQYKQRMMAVDSTRATMFKDYAGSAGLANLQRGFQPVQRTPSGFRINSGGSSFNELLDVRPDEGRRLEQTLRDLVAG